MHPLVEVCAVPNFPDCALVATLETQLLTIELNNCLFLPSCWKLLASLRVSSTVHDK